MYDQRAYDLAKLVEEGVWQCMSNALNDPDESEKWFKQADRFESKFKTEMWEKYGVRNMHYTVLTQPDLKVTYT